METERLQALEAEYKTKLLRLQNDMNVIVEKQDGVMRLKSEIERDLHRDLERVKADLKAEHEKRKTEREKYEAKISGLQEKIEELQKKLRKYSTVVGSVSDKNSAIRSYEAKISELEQEHDKKISTLIKQFEREKESAIQIMKTRIKSEVNLLVPRIKQQCASAFNQALQRCQQETAAKYREKYGTALKKMKDEHLAEKRFIQKQAKEAAEQEKQDWQRRFKSKYDMKVLELKTECEKKAIERSKRAPNVSFILSESQSEASTLNSSFSF